MLLTLLPLAGFAEDLTGQVVVAVANTEYGQEEHDIDGGDIRVTLEGGEISSTYWEIDGYYEKNDGTGEKLTLATLPVGATRYVKIVFKGAYSGYAYGQFTVDPAKVTVNIKTNDYFTMVYKGNRPAALTTDDVVATLGETDLDESEYLNIDVTKLNAYTFTGENVTATGYTINFPSDAITLKAAKAGNYVLDIKARTMKVTPALIVSDGLFTITPTWNYNAKEGNVNANNIYMYNASTLKPSYTITWNYKNTVATNDDYPLTANDFEVKFYNENGDAVANPTNAGTYTIKILGKGNFTTTTYVDDDNDEDTPDVEVPELELRNYDIVKRPLTLRTIPQNKVYDGNDIQTLLNAAEWSIVGLQGDDATTGVTGLRITKIDPLSKNVGDYKTSVAWAAQEAQPAQEAQEESYDEAEGVTADNFDEGEYYVAGDEPGEYVLAEEYDANKTYYTYTPAIPAQEAVEEAPAATIGEVELTKNYEPAARTSTWKITKRTVAITIGDLTMVKGVDEALPDPSTATITVAAKSGDTGAINNTEKTALAAAWTLSYDDADAVGEEGDDDYVPAGPMYGIEDADDAEIPGYEDAIIATAKELVDAEAAAAQAELLGNYNVSWTKGDLKVNGKGFNLDPVVKSLMEYGDAFAVTFDAYDGDDAVELPEGKTVRFKVDNVECTNANLPKTIGTHTVEIIPDATLAAGDHAGGVITYGTATYVITAKKLTLTVKAQTVHTNDPVTMITSLQAVKGTTYTLDKNTVNSEALTMTFSLDETKVELENGKITGWKVGAADHKAIKATIGTTDIDAHYDVTVVAGELTISNEFSADLAAATAAATIAEAAANGSKYDVTISGRTLNANKWNMMVLPFAVEPLKFCNAIGQYAVFNTLESVKKDETDPLKDKVYFKLELNEIPANTPFLVKPLGAVDFDEVDDQETEDEDDDVKTIVLKSVVFEGDGSDPVYTGVTGAKLTGTYQASVDINSTNWWGLQNGLINHFSAAKAKGLAFTRAYIELTSDAPKAAFFIEDVDNNGTTAIKELNTETGKAYNVDGWYTVNGIKLESMPTEKGVYINNGKKVVIK